MLHQMRLTIEKMERRLELIAPLVYRRRAAIPAFRLKELTRPEDNPPVNDDPSGWPIIEPQSYWGRRDLNFLLSGSFSVPTDFDKSAKVALYLPLGESGDFSHPDTLVYIDGEPYAAADRHHQEVVLPDRWRDGTTHRLALHGWTGLLAWTIADPGTKLFMRECQVVQLDQPTRDLLVAAQVALETAREISENDPAHDRLLNALEACFKLLDTREPLDEGGRFYASVAPAYAALRAGIAAAGAPLDVQIVATGHAHIDTAWLWTLGQTHRKAGKTFHTVLRLMEQFPEYHFVQSQPQLYDFVRQDYPALFEGIKERVADKRWEPIGGMWVEADCNITGGESLVRQFLLGRTFFRKYFGADAEARVLWLPDVFGYAWNLPQLIKLAGLEYFFTIKIGWNTYNHMPYDSFWWQGLDGTKVLTHFSTTPEAHDIHSKATYNAEIRPRTALGTWLNLQQKAEEHEILMSFGWGDGGGGPTREMLEQGRELANFPSMPQLRQGSVGQFFADLERESGAALPTWNGELYLEYHRGTYTTQSRNKRGNRKSEFLLHDAEFVSVLASLLDASYQYPHQTFHDAWELVCLNQFHDIIPGSSITPVYVESQQHYAQIRQMAEQARDEAIHVIAGQIGGDVLVINPTDFNRDDLAFWNGSLQAGQRLRTVDQRPIYTQASANGTWLSLGDEATSGVWSRFGITPLVIESGDAPALDSGLTVTRNLLENRYLRIELNDAGDLTRIYVKDGGRGVGYEVMPPNTLANQWLAFEDRPNGNDAWDIDIFYEDHVWTSEPATSVDVLEAGPLRATLEIKRKILHSEYVQRISLAYNNEQIDFDTWIDWHEKHVLLKTAFPVDVLSPSATFEVQWGNVQRPTHKNTSWDWARFETCAHKWVDLSEGGRGVSLINDCKYGHDIHDNVIRLSLLRSPTSPDPVADEGEHTFKYSLLPHRRSWQSQTASAAYELNDPLITAAGSGGSGEPKFADGLVSMGHHRNHTIIETIKQAEDGNGIIVRLYEYKRMRGAIDLKAAFPIREAYITNLLEENQEPLQSNGVRVRLEIKPFQIVTVRLIPA
ncbi:MAG TPA: glycoside hydrolase family 38 C-terminal domain-containing protein [Phototrophicaceae bacterium]|nr:glycoside hydrolase family 38 C-terminal domain-containing protein [Phototrophicaceae bacterium]